MITSCFPGLIETWHPLPELELEDELALVENLSQRFSKAAGSPREIYDRITAETPMADHMTTEAVANGDVQGWWVRTSYAPSDRAILFIHGGAYTLGSAEAYRGLASQIAARAVVNVFTLDYPRAPEHPFPAAYDAAAAAIRWLGGQGIAQLSLVGESAGGGLALAMLGIRRDSPRIASTVVFSPWTDLALTGDSFTNPQTHDPIVHRDVLNSAAAAYLNGADPRDPRASPLYGLPNRLPPLAIQVATNELVFDDARRYANRASQKGGTVRLDIYEGLHHVFQAHTRDLPSARRALSAAADFIARHWV